MCYRKVIMGLICFCSQDRGSWEQLRNRSSFVPNCAQVAPTAYNSGQPHPIDEPSLNEIRSHGEVRDLEAAPLA